MNDGRGAICKRGVGSGQRCSTGPGSGKKRSYPFSLGFTVRILSWLMVLVAIFAVVMRLFLYAPVADSEAIRIVLGIIALAR